MYRRGAKQGATDSGEGPNQSSIGCLLLSINPPLLKQMSGNYEELLQLWERMKATRAREVAIQLLEEERVEACCA